MKVCTTGTFMQKYGEEIDSQDIQKKLHQILIGVQHHFERLRSDWLPSSHYQVGRFCIISDGVFKLGVTDYSKSFPRWCFCIAFPLKVMAFNLVTDYSKSFTNCHITRGRLVVDVTDIANPSQIVKVSKCPNSWSGNFTFILSHLTYRRLWNTVGDECHHFKNWKAKTFF